MQRANEPWKKVSLAASLGYTNWVVRIKNACQGGERRVLAGNWQLRTQAWQGAHQKTKLN
jgi:hypothetical protein